MSEKIITPIVAWLIERADGSKEVVLSPLTDDHCMMEGDEATPLYAAPADPPADPKHCNTCNGSGYVTDTDWVEHLPVQAARPCPDCNVSAEPPADLLKAIGCKHGNWPGECLNCIDEPPADQPAAAHELERDKFIRAFVAGHDWLRWINTGFTSFPSERDVAELEANKRFDSMIIATPIASPSVAPKAEVFWLIEKSIYFDNSLSHFWTGVEWTPKALIAARYSDKDTATAVMYRLSDYHPDSSIIYVADHMFGCGISSAAPPTVHVGKPEAAPNFDYAKVKKYADEMGLPTEFKEPAPAAASLPLTSEQIEELRNGIDRQKTWLRSELAVGNKCCDQALAAIDMQRELAGLRRQHIAITDLCDIRFNELAGLRAENSELKRLLRDVEPLRDSAGFAANKARAEAAEREVAELKHDIARHVQITSDQAGEIERLRKLEK